MNVVCGACPAKYSIPDDKVRGRKVRIPCKHCGAAIIIDGTALQSDSAAVANKSQSLPAKPHKLSPSLPNTAGVRADASPRTTRGVQADASPRTTPGVRADASPRTTPGVRADASPRTTPAAQTNSGPMAPVQAVRPQRAIRQTIIGVAAPANSPEASPERPAQIRRPTPIYVRAPGAELLDVAQAPKTTNASGQMRSLRSTMVGGLDGEGEREGSGSAAGEPGIPQAVGAAARLPKRTIKQTNIGGLEAPEGSAPGASERQTQPRLAQDAPPGNWLAALPDGKTLRLSEKDLQRAVTKGFVNMSTLFWQSGMQDWMPLEQIPDLVAQLNAASRQPALGRPTTSKPPSPATAATGRPKPSSAKVQPVRAAPRPLAQPAATPRAGIPRASVPVTSTSKLTASVVPRPGSTAPNMTGAPVFAATLPKVTRGPESLSVRSSSPSLELVELDADDEIASIIADQDSNAEQASKGMHELERLAAASHAAPRPQQASPLPRTVVSRSITAPLGSLVPSSIQSGSVEGSNAIGAAQNPRADAAGALASIDMAKSLDEPVSRPRRKRSKIRVSLLVVLLVLACIIASYVTRQPRPLYSVLHARGWDQTIDRSVQKVTHPISSLIRKWLKR